jgi:hypothetical protein
LGDKLHLKVTKGTGEIEMDKDVEWTLLTDAPVVRFYKPVTPADDSHALLLANVTGKPVPHEVDLVPYRAGTQVVSVPISTGQTSFAPPQIAFTVTKPIIQATPVEAGKKLGIGQDVQYKAILTDGSKEIKLWNHDGADTTKCVHTTPQLTVTIPTELRDFATVKAVAAGSMPAGGINIGSGDSFSIGAKKHATEVKLKLTSTDGADPVSITIEQVVYKLVPNPTELSLLDSQTKPVTVTVQADSQPVSGLASHVDLDPSGMDKAAFTVARRKDDPSTFDVTAKTAASTGTFKLVAPDLGADAVSVNVGVKLDANRIQVSMADGTAMVLGSTARMTFRVLGADGIEAPNISGTDIAVDFDPKDQKVVSVVTDRNDPTGKTLVIRAIGRGTTQILLKYVRKADGVTVTGSVSISVSVVAGFQPIRVAIDLVNQKMAHDLFGEQTARDFFVAKVRLFNNISNQNAPDHVGDSILAYSESIEVGVELLKRDHATGVWVPLEPKDVKAKFTAAHANLENPPGGDVTRFRPGTGFGGLVPLTDQFASFAVMKRGTTDRFRLPVTSRGFEPTKYVWSVEPATIIEQVGGATSEAFHAKAVGVATVRATNVDTGAQFNTIVLVYDATGLQVNQPTGPLNPGERYTVTLTSEKDGKPIPLDGITLKASPGEVVEIVDGTMSVRGKTVGFTSVQVIKTVNGTETTLATLMFAVSSSLERAVDPPAVFLEGSQLVRYKHRFRYRPFTFDVVVNTIDEREDGGSTARIFKALDTGSQFGAFLSAIGRLGRFENIVLGQVGSSLLPSLKNLFPSKKETHRQNFVSFTMRQIEEIPFGSDISRYIFFPKGVIRGMVSDTDVRIGEIDTSYFNITAAIINKGSTTSNNAASVPDPSTGNTPPNGNNGG